MYFEINFQEIADIIASTERKFVPISPYQPITRELNFILPKKVETGEIARKIAEVHPWIRDVVVDSIFEDAEKIGENLRSVNFSFVIQSPDATLNDDETGKIQESVIAKIAEAGYKLRGM